MRPRHGRIVRWSDPARVVVQRPFYLVLLSTAVLLLVIGKANNDAATRLRAAMTDFLSPVLIVLERPLETLGDAVDTVSDLWSLQRDNERLRRDLERLSNWQEIASRLERENAVLRAQLNLRPESRSTFVTGRIIADTGGPFVRTLIIAAGARDGVVAGQAAMAEGGLAGRVVEVGERTSRLLLLNDLNSRVPVRIDGSRMRAILAGDNSARPKLLYLPQNATLSPGDRLVTSGHGGLLPPGLPVGRVASISEGEIRVTPFVDWNRLEYTVLIRNETAVAEEIDGTLE